MTRGCGLSVQPLWCWWWDEEDRIGLQALSCLKNGNSRVAKFLPEFLRLPKN